MAKRSENSGGEETVYSRLIAEIFRSHWAPDSTEFEFDREELAQTASRLAIPLPKNLGDVIYAIRYRSTMPQEILLTAPTDHEWLIDGAGRGRYRMRLAKVIRVEPRPNLVAIKIPDATPEIIAAYAQGDEQALLAKIRYNRLIDVFLGITAYSLQNHLRTSVKRIGQIEIDELYVGLDRWGTQYVVPVQAKGGTDRHSVVQTLQDVACCEAKFPNLACRPVSAQFMDGGRIALFELRAEGDSVLVAEEKHYRLVPAQKITAKDLRNYRQGSGFSS